MAKCAPNNPIITDGYQITFDFGNGFTEKPAKAKILISVVVKKPGANTLPVLQNNNIPPYIKLIRLGPITYTVCDVPIYWKKDNFPLKEIYVNPVSNTFDTSSIKPLIDLAITELSKIYANMRR